MASADALEAKRADFEKMGVFSPEMINGIISKLRKFDDADLRKKLANSQREMLDVVRKFWHCG